MSKQRKPSPQVIIEPEKVEDDFNDLISQEEVVTSAPADVDQFDDAVSDEAADGLVDEEIAAEENPADEGEIEEDLPEQGWLLLNSAPLVGIQVFISATGRDEGVRAYWKRTRRIEKGRWVMNGKWVDPITSAEIDFEPRFWKEV